MAWNLLKKKGRIGRYSCVNCGTDLWIFSQSFHPERRTQMKKIIVLVLVVLGLLAVMPAMELDSSTQVFSRVGMAEGDGGGGY